MSMLMSAFVLTSLAASGLTDSANTHPGHEPVVEWNLVPPYVLPGAGGRVLIPLSGNPVEEAVALRLGTPELHLFGERPTARLVGLENAQDWGLEAFTVELLVLDHVNRPAGGLLALRDAASGRTAWSLAYHNERLHLKADRVGFARSEIIADELPRGWKSYWHHVVASYDGAKLSLYHNGELAGELEIGAIDYPDGQLGLELAAYMSHEPHMDLANMFKVVRIDRVAVSQQEIRSRFSEHQAWIEAGHLVPGVFHLNAGPYLHLATQHSMNLVWETSEPSTAVVRYGTSVPLDKEILVTDAGTIHELTIDGLEPDTPYFYEISARSTDPARAEELSTGVLSFKTASPAGEPIRFAVLGDPEARPHVNDAMAKLVWNERPDFMLQVGDLTDGGKEPNKFQWNHEYFLGLTQLNSRVPVYPVPGNGEGDLYWYSRYHRIPQSPDSNEGYYTFTYGDVQFFMLDSNQRGPEFSPGGQQYEWLEAELSKSTARWKVAAHHHPAYTSDENDYGNTWETTSPLGDLRVRPIAQLYEKYGVDVVFFGHLHTYERTLPIRNGRYDRDGVVYIQAGGAGGNLEDFAPTPSWFSGRTHRGHHYVMAYQVGDSLEIRMYNDDGAMLDIHRIEK